MSYGRDDRPENRPELEAAVTSVMAKAQERGVVGSTIEHHIATLEEQLVQVEDRLSLLLHRISPVMLPENTVDSVPEEAEKWAEHTIPHPKSSVAARLDGSTVDLRKILHRLNNAIERLHV